MKTNSQKIYETLEILALEKIGGNWKDGLWKFTGMGFGDKVKKQLIRALRYNKNKTIERWKALIKNETQ